MKKFLSPRLRAFILAILAIWIVLFSGSCDTQQKVFPTISLPVKEIRIGILRKYRPQKIIVKSKNLHISVDGHERRLHPEPLAIEMNRNNSIVFDKSQKAYWILLDSSTLIEIQLPELSFHRFYPGSIEISGGGEFLQVVNTLPVEQYVRRAAVAELGAGINDEKDDSPWIGEWRKAQEIAIRSYLFASLNRHRKEGFHLCDLAHCVNYRGAGEDPLSLDKIDPVLEWSDREIPVLVDKKKRIIPALFHSSCGGKRKPEPGWTDNANLLFPDREKGDTIDLCADSPDAHWTAYFDRELFDPREDSPFPIPGAAPVVRTKNGRVHTILYRGINGVSVELPINVFMGRIASERMIRSDFFTIEVQRHGFLVRGQGRGHGRGLCQWGAKTLAMRGRTAKEILEFYYPDTILVHGVYAE